MQILFKIWDWLTAPSLVLTRPDERRQAQLLATLLAFLLLLGVIVEIVVVVASSPLDHYRGFYVTGSSVVILVVAYGLSRTRHYKIAIWLTIILSSVSVFAATIYGSAPGEVGLLFFLILPVLFASMFTSLRATFIVLLANLAGTLGMLLLYPEVRLIDLPLGYLVIIPGLMMLATHHRQQLERDRRAELAASERRYRTVVDHQTELICRFDPDGTLTFVNATYCRYFDQPREALIGQSFLPLVLEADREKVMQHLAAFSQEKRVATITYRVVAAGDKVRWQQWIDRPIFDQQGNIIAFQSVGRDATEQVKAEKALQKAHNELERRVQERTAELRATNAELARAARAKDEFLANMSHELRTPLHALLGKAETLQEETFGPLNEKQIDALHTIEASGRHLLAMVNDILDVAKIEAGKLQLTPSPVAVSSLCESSLRLIKQSAQKKHIEISFKRDDQVEVIWADGRRLKQVLVNLLSNAVKFTPAGGQIGLDVRCDTQEKIVHLTVWDTGVGISPEDLERVFQPFVQLDSSLSRQHTGTGLGLSLVQHLTELHGGKVTAESKRGQGSRFIVSLPWKTYDDYAPSSSTTRPVGATEKEPQNPPCPETGLLPTAIPSPAPSAQPETTILLAEDNKENIDTISEYLQFKGYQVIVAHNGSEALTRATEARPDLILMDIQMPEMDGLQVIQRIRADARLAKVPIIALTALAMSGDRGRCLNAGANQYLSKPVRLAKLTDVIAALLKQSTDDKS